MTSSQLLTHFVIQAGFSKGEGNALLKIHTTCLRQRQIRGFFLQKKFVSICEINKTILE